MAGLNVNNFNLISLKQVRCVSMSQPTLPLALLESHRNTERTVRKGRCVKPPCAVGVFSYNHLLLVPVNTRQAYWKQIFSSCKVGSSQE